MTSQEHLAKMKELLAKSTQNVVKQAMVPAANEMLAEIKNRIQIDGKKTDGSQIGQYSVKPDYFTKDQFVKKGAFKPQGKGGYKGEKVVDAYRLGRYNPRLKSFSRIPTKVVVKNEVGSMFLPAGYKQFRDIQGRPTDKINETLSGDTLLAYQQQVNQDEVLQGFTTVKSSKIRQGQEKKRGKIFYPSSQELNFYKENVTKTIQLLQLDALR